MQLLKLLAAILAFAPWLLVEANPIGNGTILARPVKHGYPHASVARVSKMGYPEHGQCGFGPIDGTTMRNTWFLWGVDVWLEAEMKYFFEHPEEFDGDTDFKEYLVKMYAPDMDPSAFDCNILQTCQVCEFSSRRGKH